VVKLGWRRAGGSGARPGGCALAQAARELAGAQLVVVHGGGAQVTALSGRLGIETRMAGGRRITDAASLEVLEMVVAGRLNVELCAALRRLGLAAVGLHAGSGVIRARRRPPGSVSGGGPDPIDFGLVGDVTGFDTALLAGLWRDGYLPVLSCLGLDQSGQVLNLNGDLAASQLAAALTADSLVAVTAVGGVRADATDPATRLPQLTIAEAARGHRRWASESGMIPKLEEACAAIDGGRARRAHRRPGRDRHRPDRRRFQRSAWALTSALEFAQPRGKLAAVSPRANRMRLYSAFTLAVVLAVALLAASVPAAQAPEIRVATVADVQKRIKNRAQRAVLVNVWATWCQPCVKEMPGHPARLPREQGPRAAAGAGVGRPQGQAPRVRSSWRAGGGFPQLPQDRRRHAVHQRPGPQVGRHHAPPRCCSTVKETSCNCGRGQSATKRSLAS
jgi:acetylglutamate kinase